MNRGHHKRIMGCCRFSCFHAIATTSILTAFTLFGLLAFAQTPEDGNNKASISISTKPTSPEDIDPSIAITVSDRSIPIDQLELLTNPLTIEQLQVESAAWFLVLQKKAKQISTIEIVIKRENLAIMAEENALRILEKEKEKLIAAEIALTETSPGTPANERATQQFEQAKRSLQNVEALVENASAIVKVFQSKQFIQRLLENAEFEEKLIIVQKILKEAKQGRRQIISNPSLFIIISNQIEQLETALFQFENINKKLIKISPSSDSYQTLFESLERTKTEILNATKTLSESTLVSLSLEERVSIDSQKSKDILTEVFEEIQLEDIEIGDINEKLKDTSKKWLDGAVEQLDEVTESQRIIKNKLVAMVVQLQEEQLAIIHRFDIILNALERKGGDTQSYRLYINDLSGMAFDFRDRQGLKIRVLNWLKAKNGGIRLGIQLAKFFGVLFATVAIAPWLGKGTNQILSRIDRVSSLLRDFTSMLVYRGAFMIGGMMAISSLGISLGPLLAWVGGASFVLAFALQSNLGNIVSGLMLMVNKPFDVGDEVKIAGYWAYVHSISLTSTKLVDFSGNLVTLPNNTVWGGDIINYTHSDIRKHMFKMYITFAQDISIVYKMWIELASANPNVLDDPRPGWFPWNEHYEYYICIGLSAWTKTDVYWDVYVELLQALQVRTQELEIELAIPVQKIKIDPLAI